MLSFTGGAFGMRYDSAMTNVVNFSSHSGKVMGLLSAAMALGAALFAVVAREFGMDDPPVGYPLSKTNCTHTSSVPLSGPTAEDDSMTPMYFFLMAAILLFLVGLLGAATLVRKKDFPPVASEEQANFALLRADSDGLEMDWTILTAGVDIYGWSLLRNLDFWLLFFTMAVEDGWLGHMGVFWLYKSTMTMRNMGGRLCRGCELICVCALQLSYLQ